MIPPSFEKGGVTLNQSLFSGFIVADTFKYLFSRNIKDRASQRELPN